MTETVTGRLITMDGAVFHLETDEGERVVFTLAEASGVLPHHLEGIVHSPVRIEVTIEGPHDCARVTCVRPSEQHHLKPPIPSAVVR